LYTLLFLVGFLIGIFGNFIGVGGGFILVPLFLALYKDLSPANVTQLSLFCVALNSVVGVAQAWLRKMLDWRRGLLLGLGSWPGVFFGQMAVTYFAREQFSLIYVIILVILLLYLLNKNSLIDLAEESKTRVKNEFMLLLFIGSVVGLLAGFFGIGGGLFYVPVLMAISHLKMRKAVSTSLLSVFITSAFIVVWRGVGHADLMWSSQILIIAFGMIVGGQLGGWLLHKVDAKWVKRVFIALLLLLIIKTATDLLVV